MVVVSILKKINKKFTKSTKKILHTKKKKNPTTFPKQFLLSTESHLAHSITVDLT